MYLNKTIGSLIVALTTRLTLTWDVFKFAILVKSVFAI